ncbi:MAG: GNAT family protein [Alphaproteobacteria bacterium]|nr:GNAT family protein [Alphaproteobacteria bacterium]
MKLIQQGGGLAPSVEVATRLQHGRVLLRAARETDWRQYAELRAASRTFLEPWEPTWPSDSLTRLTFQRRLHRYQEEWHRGIGFTFFIFAAIDDALLGGIGVTNIRRGVAQAGTIGYWIGETHAGMGLMGEALEAVLAFCFDELGLHRAEAACLPSNERSRRLLERAGFVREGYAEKYLKIRGAWQDHLLFGLRTDEFQKVLS